MACNCKGLPPVATMARNAVGAALRASTAAITGESVLVDSDTFNARMAVCRACPNVIAMKLHNQDWHRCAKCGCWLDGKFVAKAKLATETCPESKWP